MQAKRIAIIGISGSGKSVFARELSKRTGLPLFHMDNLFWKGEWEAVPESKYLEDEQELIKKDTWIIEGYVDEKESDRLQVADLVIYLDYPGIFCFLRVIKRWLMHRRVSRPELPKEALERLHVSFLWVVLMRKERPGIEKALELSEQKNVVRIHSPRRLHKFLETSKLKIL